MKKFYAIIISTMIACLLSACNRPSETEVAPTESIQVDVQMVEPVEVTLIPTPTIEPTSIPPGRADAGDRAFENGEWDIALEAYQTALIDNADPEVQAAALLGMGRSYYELGDISTARTSFSRIIDEYPDSPYLPDAYYFLAKVYEDHERYQDAAISYQMYLKLRPGVIDSYVNEWRGDALTAAGDYPAGIQAYIDAMGSDRLGGTIPLEIKIGMNYAALGDYDTALVAYSDIYTRTTNDYTKAAMDYLMGSAYVSMGQLEEAYASYHDAVVRFPLAYDTYLGLIQLVEAGYPVSEFDRGVIDYYAGQYSLAISAFDRYLMTSGEYSGAAYYFKGLAYLAIDNPDSAIVSWNHLIEKFPEDDYWDEAWDEKGYTQWAYLDQYDQALETYLGFVDENPYHERAAEFLFFAGQVAERKGDLDVAASIWHRIPIEYATSNHGPRAVFLAGISQYRAGQYETALESFNQASLMPGDEAAIFFWIGKTNDVLGHSLAAEIAWQKAVNADPTGYYSERARDILRGREPFTPPVMYDLAFDPESEREAAEDWMRDVFAIQDGVDLSGPGWLLGDLRLVRGTELWRLGLKEEARSEFEDLRNAAISNPVDTYRLTNYLVELGLYRSAIFSARQVLNLNHMDDAMTMNAPIYFNHVRFGSYYDDLIVPIAVSYDIHPLLLFSVVRQESLFEGFVRSSAGARGLMQIMPATGQSIATNAGWPPGYVADDLYRARVNITFGAHYLAQQRDYFDHLYPALAAYNAGPGNAAVWWRLADGDPDLFLETIRYKETRDYIRGIYEVFSIYRIFYDRTP